MKAIRWLIPVILVLGCSGGNHEAAREEPQLNDYQAMQAGQMLQDLERVVRENGIKAVPVELMSFHLADTAMVLGQDLCYVPTRLRDEQVITLYIARNASPKADCVPDRFRGMSEQLPVLFWPGRGSNYLISRDSLATLERNGFLININRTRREDGSTMYEVVGLSTRSAFDAYSAMVNLPDELDRVFRGGRIREEYNGSSDGESLIYAVQGLSGGTSEVLRRSLDNMPAPLKRQLVQWGVALYARYNPDGHYAKQYILPFNWQFVSQLPDREAAFASDSALERAYWASRTAPIQVGRLRVTHDQWVVLEWMKRRGPEFYNALREELRRRFH